MDSNKLPIGYWVKQVDQLLTEGINKIQATFELTRSDWQILNLLSERQFTGKQTLFSTMQPFMDSTTAGQVLAALKQKGLINFVDDSLELTDLGKKQYLDCLERQKEFRQKAVKDITPEDYQTTVATLQKITNNLKV